MLEEKPLVDEHATEAMPQAQHDADALAAALHAPAPAQADSQAAPAATDEADATEKFNDEQLRSVINHILEEQPDEFTEHLKTASLHEMAMLMEELARRPVERNNIRKVGLIKKQFDETLDKTLQELNQQIDADANNEEAKETKELNVGYSQRLGKALVAFNKKRQDFEAQQAQEREHNLVLKKELLETLKGIVMNEQVTAIDKVRTIQNKWRAVGQVTQAEADNLIQSYRTYLDQFYGMRAKYNELLEQDRKVNLEEKEKIIHELETLTAGMAEKDAESWQAATETVKQLHDNWKHVGPVPREQSEAQWGRFKTATDAFYDARRAFYETVDAERGVNTDKKRAVLERMQPLAVFEGTAKEAWADATRQMFELQKEWTAIGPVTLEAGRTLFKQYRDFQNGFFKKRSAFFETVNAGRADLVKKKEELLVQAEAAVQETDTHVAADKLKSLQRQWRDTGPDDYKEARKVQKKFRKVCDAFFGKLKEIIAAEHKEQEDNLAKKTQLLEKLEALAAGGATPEIEGEVKALEAEWNAIGHVPIKQKDKVIGRYRQAMDVLRPRGHRSEGGRDFNRGDRAGNRFGGRNDNRRDNRGGKFGAGRNNQPVQDRTSPDERRVTGRMRQLEELVQQLENNILFIGRGKGGDALRAEYNGKIETARAELATLKKELKALRNPAPAPAEAPKAEVKAEANAMPAAEAPAAPAADASAQMMGEAADTTAMPEESVPVTAPTE
jgi:hypothetical protein